MARIRITKVPQGFQPETVREAWVGLEFDAESIPRAQALRLGMQPGPVWVLDGEDAFEALEDERPEAHRWWREHFRGAMTQLVAFPTAICEVIA